MISLGHRVFANEDLLPDGWASERPTDDYYITNPSINRVNGQWIMAYKVVTRGYAVERFAICRLDATLAVEPGSALPLSDTIPNVTSQVGDPRLVIFRERLWAVYCHFRLPSMLYLVEINPQTLTAAGLARPLLLDDRQWQEKNWMLFEYAGDLWAVYTIVPHVVLHLDVRQNDAVRCRRSYVTEWDVSAYQDRYGEPRGGTPPVRVDDDYYVFFHSRHFTDPRHAAIAPAWSALRAWLGRPEHWRGPRLVSGDVRPLQTTTDWIYTPKRLPLRLDGLMRRYERRYAKSHYVTGFYGFCARPPFAPFLLSHEPVLRPEDEPAPRHYPRLSPLNERVVFPGGAAFLRNGRWLLSYGVNDELCALRELGHVNLLHGSMRSPR